MTTWEIKVATHGTIFMHELLRDGWEPFAVTVDIVTSTNPNFTKDWSVWFRKSNET